MPELLTAPTGSTAHAADIARRVADVVERVGSANSGATEAAEFLRDWADTATNVPDSRGLANLTARYRLTDIERDLLVLAGLPEEHEGLAATFRAMHPAGEPWPTVGIAALTLESTGVDRGLVRGILRDGALCRQGLVCLAGKGPFFERSIQPGEQLWDALHDHESLPEWLPGVTIPDPPAGLADWAEADAARRAALALGSPDARTIVLAAADEPVALSRCAALAARAQVALLGARCRSGDRRAIGVLVAHAAARGRVPVVLVEPEPDGSPSTPTLAVDHHPGPVIVCTTPGSVRLPAGRPVLTVPAGTVDPSAGRAAWHECVPELNGRTRTLAARHPLDPAHTQQIRIDAASLRGLGARFDSVAGISALVRARASVTLPPGVDIVTPDIGWDRLVLPADIDEQLRDAVARLDHQAEVLDDWRMRERARAARGVRVLLTGPPGTGKSLAAEALATAAGTDLCRVDTAQLVSKWIGETEKNLAAAFDVAEQTQAVLFLDEADAICGARTKVVDAHDRYANLETAYLLQRFDRFDGLVVLASNIRSNIDAAFLRRMDVVAELPVPDEASRLALWRLHLPAGRLAADVDPGALARMYPVAGGWIRNAAIAAAFRAAAAGSEVRTEHVVGALRREFAKAASPFPGELPRRRDDL